jgi:hypothetical protein
MHRSYKVKKSCLETAGGVLVCEPPLTMLAQKGAGLGRGALPGRALVSPILHPPACDPCCEGGGGCAPAPHPAFRCRPRRGGGGGRHYPLVVAMTVFVAGLTTLLLPPLPQLGGVAGSWGGARVQPLALVREVCSPWWLTEN